MSCRPSIPVALAILALISSQAPCCHTSNLSDPGLVDVEGELSWLADASEYTLAEHVISVSYGHTILVDLGESLVRLCAPEGFPWDAVLAIMDNDAPIEETAQEFIMLQIPILVVTGIFLLLAIFLPIVGFCFCCCRCCGNCGGKRTEEKRNQQNRCNVFLMAPFILIFCALIGFCTIMNKPIEDRIIDSSFDLAYTTLYTTYDIQTFTDNIVMDFEELGYGDFDEFSENLLNKIDRVGDDIAGPFVDQSLNYINDINSHLMTFNLDLHDLVLGNIILTDLNQTISAIIGETADLDAALGAVASDLAVITDACLADPVMNGAGICGSLPDIDLLDIDIDISQLQAATGSLDPSGILASFTGPINDIFSLLEEANNSISSIPELIRNETTDLSSTVNSSLVDIGASIRDMVNSSTAMLADVDVDELLQVHQLESEIDWAEDYRSEYASYIIYQFIVKAIFGGGMLVIFSLLGLCVGCIWNESPPGRQSRAADCGGQMSMCAAAWAFLLAFWICFAASILFLLGSNLTLICDDLQDLSIIEEVVDNPDMWDGSHPLQGLGLGDNLTFKSLLEQCGNDSTIATVMGLMDSEAMDMGSLDLSQQLPDLGDIGDSINASFSAFEFSDMDVSSQLDGLSGQIMPPDISTQIDEINSVIASVDIDSIAGDLDTQAAAISGTYPGMAGSLTDMATELRRIQDDIIDAITADTGVLQTQLNELDSAVENLMAGTDSIIANFTSFSNFLANDAVSVLFESLETYFDEVVAIGQDFIDSSFDKIENDIGRCGVIRLVYDAFVDGICVGFVGAITLAWLTSALFALCLIPFVCLNVRVAKYHRLPTSDAASRRYSRPPNKVHPVNV